MGISWFGMIQRFVAAQQPPHLAAIFPYEAANDLYGVAYEGGVIQPFWWELEREIPAHTTQSESEKLYSPEELEARHVPGEGPGDQDAVAPLDLAGVEQEMKERAQAEHREHPAGCRAPRGAGSAQQERDGERGLRIDVVAQVEGIDARHEPALDGASQDPGDVGKQAPEVDPADVDTAKQAPTQGPLNAEVSEGVGHAGRGEKEPPVVAGSLSATAY